MHVPSRRARTRSRAIRRVFATVAALGFVACSGQEKAAGPVLPPAPPDNPQLVQAAFVFHVNTATGQVVISKPQSTVNSLSGPARSGLGGPGGPSFSLIGGDAIDLIASNFAATGVGTGGALPGKIRVSFDLAVLNQLNGVDLITPTFPTPPPGVSGIIIFPFATHVTVTNGGVSVGGSGDSVIIELPNRGEVAPSTDWDGDGTAGSGAPFNFFNDTGCPAGSNDCYRWEAFAQPLTSGSVSASRKVGFDIEPTVANFSAKIIVAADLRNGTASTPGTVGGTVSSPQRGALGGVTVNVSGGFTGTTSGTGSYSIPNVAIGGHTVTLSGLPAGCTDPGSNTAVVSSGQVSTVNFTVQCSVASGSVSGTITRSGTGTQLLDGTVITATPAAAGTSPASTTLAAGALTYTINGVQIGSGTGAGNGSVALTNLPAGCTSAAGSYTGLVLGGSATVNFTVSCAAPAALYQYRATWGAISGGQVTLSLSFDPSTLNDPLVNGTALDDFNSFQATIAYSATRLQFVSCANAAGSAFQNINANGATAGSINLLNFLNGPGSTTQQTVGVCTFNVLAGAATSVTTATSLVAISSFNGDNLIPNTQKTEGTLTIP